MFCARPFAVIAACGRSVVTVGMRWAVQVVQPRDGCHLFDDDDDDEEEEEEDLH